jgi:hypothetical protein
LPWGPFHVDLFVKLKSDLESIKHPASITSFDVDDFDSVFNENSKYDREAFSRNPYKLLVNNLYKAKVAQTKVKNQLKNYFTNKLFSELYEVKFTEKREGLEDVDKKLILLSDKDLTKSKTRKTYTLNETGTNYWRMKYCSNESGKLQLADYKLYANEADIKLMSHVPYTDKGSDVILYSKTVDSFSSLHEIINNMVNDPQVNPFVKALYMETFLKKMANVGISPAQTKKIWALSAGHFMNPLSGLHLKTQKEKELNSTLRKYLARDFNDLDELLERQSKNLTNLLKSLNIRLQDTGAIKKEAEK